MKLYVSIPYINRFLSADTIVPDPTDPQSYNRYSYVRNNPINFTDPTGHDRCGAAGEVCKDEVPIVPIEAEWPFNDENPYSTLIDTEFAGADGELLNAVMIVLWYEPDEESVNNALRVLADIRGLELEEVQRQYVRYYQLKTQANAIGNHNEKGIVEGSEHWDWWGSTEQLRFGKITGDAFGLDPVFGSLLSPTGGRIGTGDSGGFHNALSSSEAMNYHGQAHDAAGYLYNYHNSGPGYTYARPDAPESQRGDFWMGQRSGYTLWKDLLVTENE